MPIYFDNAATSHPKPEGVMRAVARAMTELNALWNESVDRYYAGWDSLREKGRGSLPGDVSKLYETCWADGFQAYTAGWNAMHTEQQAVEAALAAGDTDIAPILSRLAQERAEELEHRQAERAKKAEEEPEEYIGLSPVYRNLIFSPEEIRGVGTDELMSEDFFGEKTEGKRIPGPFAGLREGEIIMIDPRRTEG